MKRLRPAGIALALLTLGACFTDDKTPRQALFIGVDVSGSFMKQPSFDDSLDFLSYYIYAHLKGLGGLEVPKSMFVGSIGGSWINDAKTFYPIETFQDKTPAQIRATLGELFPRGRNNALTDFNSFFKQIALFIQNKNLILKPIAIVMASDGVPDAGKLSFGTIKVAPLETLSRNITVRLLYTDANTGNGWQNKVKRSRVKVWTQDASVMVRWKEPTLFDPTQPFETQEKLFSWIKDNVDFPVKGKRVD